MQALLNDQLAPITDEMGFLECDLACAVNAYLEWQGPIQAARFVSFDKNAPHGTLHNVLRSLLPLTSVERRRFLFLPTASSWTAFFDNGHKSTDAFSAMSYLARTIGCRGLRVSYIPNDAAPSRHPARIFEMYGPVQTEWLNVIRAVGVVSDKKWSFHEGGSVQPFEQPERYKQKPIKDRFTPEMLNDYLTALGIRAFDEDFYGSNDAVLLSKAGSSAANLREFFL